LILLRHRGTSSNDLHTHDKGLKQIAAPPPARDRPTDTVRCERPASVVNFDNVHVVPTACLGDRIGALSASREQEVKRALGHALGWTELKVL